MSAEYHDELTLPQARINLWAQVLAQAITDATKGLNAGRFEPQRQLREIEEVRRYLTQPNRGFNEVCHLAGLEPEAVRERATKLIEAAPSAEQLAGIETVH